MTPPSIPRKADGAWHGDAAGATPDGQESFSAVTVERLPPADVSRRKTPGAGVFGTPMLADAAGTARIFGRIQMLSQACGTAMTIRDGVGYITIP
jgi:hypothetical protein